ncbi:MAG: WD40 repeat domain-containing protein [Treponema sp.]
MYKQLRYVSGCLLLLFLISTASAQPADSSGQSAAGKAEGTAVQTEAVLHDTETAETGTVKTGTDNPEQPEDGEGTPDQTPHVQQQDAPAAPEESADEGAGDEEPEEQPRLLAGLPVKDVSRRTQIVRRFAGGVSAIADSAATRSFFAAGKDGFITRYSYGRLRPETWQVSALPVKLIAVHPKKNYIAVYETDGFSVHKISLWDWQAKKQLYVKRFSNSVLSLAWSAQGSYLFIGTASAEGITVLDVRGNVKKVYPRPPGIVLLAATGPSEKSIVTYGETGRLVYADIAKRSILTQYETEDRLQSPELFKNYTRIAGYKNGTVVVIKAASGEILETYPARSALFAGKITDTLPVWIEEGEVRFSWYLCQGEKKSPAFTLPYQARITAARHVDAAIVIGTDDGRLYRLQQGSDAAVTLTEINKDTALPVSDICVKDSTVYMLAGTVLYAADAPAEEPQPLITDITAQRCTPYGSGFLLWSDTKTAPLYYAEAGSEPSVLYRPREPLHALSVYGTTIAAVHSFGRLILLDGKSGKQLFEYQAAGLQEAVQIDGTFILVSKTAGGTVQKPLLLINTATGETIPLGLEGEVAFSLHASNQHRNAFSCLRMKGGDAAQTGMVMMNINPLHPARSNFSTLLSYDDEDISASLYDEGNAAVTNLGQGQAVYYDKNRKKVSRLMRDYALPRRLFLTPSYIISVNYDGSLSWFQRRSLQLLENYRLMQ